MSMRLYQRQQHYYFRQKLRKDMKNRSDYYLYSRLLFQTAKNVVGWWSEVGFAGGYALKVDMGMM